MNFAKKLREVVTSNFIEIARTEEERDAAEKTVPEIDRAVPPAYMDARPAPPSLEPAPIVPIAPLPPEPEPVTAPAIPPVPRLKVDERPLIERVAPNEPVDLERVLREADLPEVAFTAEQASKVLSALPYDLPMQVKRLTVKATLEAVERGRTISPQEIVADAMLKKAYIGQYQEAFHEQVEALLQETDSEIATTRARIEVEIARLKAEVERLNAQKEAVTRKRRAVETAAEERVNRLEQVVVFFQSEVSANLPAPAAQEDDDDIPPFMRDDAVFRMLGLEEEIPTTQQEENEAVALSKIAAEDTPAGHEPVEHALDETTTNGSGRRARNRRRIPVAENVEA